VRYRYRIFGHARRFTMGPPAPDCPAAALPAAAPPVNLAHDRGWEAVKEEVDRGSPVLVALQAWARGPEDYLLGRWDSGHYAVVVGYDAHRVYFADPSTMGNYTYVGKEEFLARWYDFEGELSASGDRCPGGVSYYRLGLALEAEAPTRFRWSAVVPME
jgi:hypothetical protein